MQLGKTQPLRIVKKVDFGVYLAEEEDQENRVLLPVKQSDPVCKGILEHITDEEYELQIGKKKSGAADYGSAYVRYGNNKCNGG